MGFTGAPDNEFAQIEKCTILVARGVRVPMGLALGPRRLDAFFGLYELVGEFRRGVGRRCG